MAEADYIVVGGGSAGCALARKLSDDESVNVLVLEAGGPAEVEAIHDPRAWPSLWGTDVDWDYKTTPQPGTAGRVHDWPRGRVLGGTGCLNAMQFMRGDHSDFDAWAYAGNPGWDYQSVLPYFIELEDNEGGASAYHGAGGPMHVSTLREKDPNPTSVAFVEACLELGYPANDDFNGERLAGVGFNPVSIKAGRRQSGGVAFIEPVVERANLEVRTNAPVARLLFEGRRCVGAELTGGERVLAGEEVVVCCGAIDSPRMLILSGLGPAEQLRGLGVEVVEDLPGVGENLHDHLLLGVVYEGAQPVPEGMNNLSESQLFWRSDARLLGPDIQIALVHVPFHSPEFSAPANSYTVAPGIVRPLSRGSVRVAEAQPGGRLEIDAGYLTEEADVQGLIHGIELSREIGEAPAFASWRKREVLPGPDVTSPDALRSFVEKAASTYYHPVGTCKMGPDSMSVVDHELRVHGVEGLRVADASIMPAIVSANPNAAITMIGYKAAAMLRGIDKAADGPLAAAV